MAKKEFTDVDYEMFVMPFGKHAGKTFEEIPAGYLLWLSTESDCPDIISAYVDLHDEELAEKAEDEDDSVDEERDDWDAS